MPIIKSAQLPNNMADRLVPVPLVMLEGTALVMAVW